MRRAKPRPEGTAIRLKALIPPSARVTGPQQHRAHGGEADRVGGEQVQLQWPLMGRQPLLELAVCVGH